MLKRLLALIFSCFPLAVAAHTIDLGPVTVEKDTGYQEMISPQGLPFSSWEEVIDYSSGVDLRKRGPFGIQQDIALRGTSRIWLLAM